MREVRNSRIVAENYICLLCRQNHAYNWAGNICLECCNSANFEIKPDQIKSTPIKNSGEYGYRWHINNSLIYLSPDDRVPI